MSERFTTDACVCSTGFSRNSVSFRFRLTAVLQKATLQTKETGFKTHAGEKRDIGIHKKFDEFDSSRLVTLSHCHEYLASRLLVVARAKVADQDKRITKNVDDSIEIDVTVAIARDGISQITNQGKRVAQHVNAPVKIQIAKKRSRLTIVGLHIESRCAVERLRM